MANYEHPGPAVARLYNVLLGGCFLAAWLSLNAQWSVLMGSDGLLPLATFLRDAQAAQGSFWQLPTVFWLDASDATLQRGIWLGVTMAVGIVLGVFPRTLLGLSTALYLSYVVAGRTFTSFQWDNLLLECGFLATLLPTRRRCWLAHWMMRLLLVKLYFESGLAKWQSSIGDWQDGSAMNWYYETAPLPTWVAYYFHHLPQVWHHIESIGTLALELVLPWLALFLGLMRVPSVVLLTGFQILNAATANYGFFVPLAVSLHVFLLTDAQLLQVWEPVAGVLRKIPLVNRLPAVGGYEPETEHGSQALHMFVLVAVSLLFLGISICEGAVHFADMPARYLPFGGNYQALRLINTYHLFGSITRERVEPELQTFDGKTWTPQDLWHKPGDPAREPDFVAPHQPRVDFQLWFHGLAPRQTPPYIATLQERLCHDPGAVQPLFRNTLPAHPRAVRLTYWRYHFASLRDHENTGVWWTRAYMGARAPWACDGAR